MINQLLLLCPGLCDLHLDLVRRSLDPLQQRGLVDAEEGLKGLEGDGTLSGGPQLRLRGLTTFRMHSQPLASAWSVL